MLGSLIVVYVQFVIMLTELKKVLSQELKRLYVYQDYHSPIRMNCTRNCGCKPLTFLLHY